MNQIRTLLTLFCLALLSGCGSDTYKGPVALEGDQLAPAIREAFAAAPQATREMAEKAVTLFESEKYPESIAEFRRICALPLGELTDERRQIASRCLITLTARIKEQAAEKNDKSAEQYIKYNHATK